MGLWDKITEGEAFEVVRLANEGDWDGAYDMIHDINGRPVGAGRCR